MSEDELAQENPWCVNGLPVAFTHPVQGGSRNTGIPKSFILVGFSIINQPFWGIPIYGKPHMQSGSYLFCFFSGTADPR